MPSIIIRKLFKFKSRMSKDSTKMLPWKITISEQNQRNQTETEIENISFVYFIEIFH